MKLFVLAARASAAAALAARVCAKPSFFLGDARANVVYHPPLFLTICPRRRGPSAHHQRVRTTLVLRGYRANLIVKSPVQYQLRYVHIPLFLRLPF